MIIFALRPTTDTVAPQQLGSYGRLSRISIWSSHLACCSHTQIDCISSSSIFIRLVFYRFGSLPIVPLTCYVRSFAVYPFFSESRIILFTKKKTKEEGPHPREKRFRESVVCTYSGRNLQRSFDHGPTIFRILHASDCIKIKTNINISAVVPPTFSLRSRN